MIRGTVEPKECSFIWSIPEWSNIKADSEVRSPYFQGRNYQWYLKVKKGVDNNKEHVGIYLNCGGTLLTGNSNKLKLNVKAEIAIMPPTESTLESLVRRIKNPYDLEKSTGRGYSQFISMADVDDYLDNGMFTISVKLEELDTHQLKVKPNPMIQAPLQFDSSLISQFHDITIRVFESEEESETSDEDDVSESTEKEIILRGVDPKVFERILDFVHTNKIDIGSIKDCASLLREADKFIMERFISEVVYYLQLSISCSTLWEIWNIADDYNLIELEETCVAFMRSNCVDLFADPGWINVKESVALKALQINNLQTNVNESVFYEAVLQWRESNLKNMKDENKWNETGYNSGSYDEKLEDQIVSLECQLKKLRSIQRERKKTSTENKVPGTKPTHNISQLKEYTREERVLEWKLENTTLSQLDQIFASMIYCIVFSKMSNDYIMDVVENNVDVMRVRGIDYLLREAYRHGIQKGPNTTGDELRSQCKTLGSDNTLDY